MVPLEEWLCYSLNHKRLPTCDCHQEEAEPLGGRAWREEVRSLGVLWIILIFSLMGFRITGNKPLGVSARVFLERFDWGGWPTLNKSSTISWGRGWGSSRLSRKESGRRVAEFISHSFLSVNTMWPAPHTPAPCCPHQDKLYMELQTMETLPSLSGICWVLCHRK